jgi:hypothetical protein
MNDDFDVDGIPHGWIQWKGTEVCIDLHCVCGHLGHFDGDFFYFYECSECHRKYRVGQNIKLIELTSDEDIDYANRNCGFK